MPCPRRTTWSSPPPAAASNSARPGRRRPFHPGCFPYATAPRRERRRVLPLNRNPAEATGREVTGSAAELSVVLSTVVFGWAIPLGKVSRPGSDTAICFSAKSTVPAKSPFRVLHGQPVVPNVQLTKQRLKHDDPSRDARTEVLYGLTNRAESRCVAQKVGRQDNSNSYCQGSNCPPLQTWAPVPGIPCPPALARSPCHRELSDPPLRIGAGGKDALAKTVGQGVRGHRLG
ncbi:hypothetical protein QF047_000751 [Arthrobacter sp. W4I7]|nr:hypothetical protein [Arthrobacter sp. W4I7]